LDRVFVVVTASEVRADPVALRGDLRKNVARWSMLNPLWFIGVIRNRLG
jgi:hypothetical protein